MFHLFYFQLSLNESIRVCPLANSKVKIHDKIDQEQHWTVKCILLIFSTIFKQHFINYAKVQEQQPGSSVSYYAHFLM